MVDASVAPTLTPDEVRQLAAHAALGDRDAFGALCAAYRHDLLAYARRRLPQPEDAEDVLQVTFLKALRSIHKRDQSRPFNVWLFHIASNTITDFYRTRKITAGLDALPDPVGSSAEEQALASHLDARLEAAFVQLTARQRWVIRLRVIEGHSYEEIAERLNCSAGAARATQMRALQALRAALEAPAAERLAG
ncbi:MAG: sigma-70 family RNA polymerase sigma factor [Chloroflexi bacterium]|nr:sigma-70 family RNA polymerase sigma factor [Chloroflexota bacterium]MDA1003446.1 sigma-70 family RNA polymerase sigma factor [Chloroflexota bacterium]